MISWVKIKVHPFLPLWESLLLILQLLDVTYIV